MNHREKAEKIAEVYAASFLKDAIGHDLFIGSHIERLLADKVNLIYQYVEDENYFGAAIKHQNGEQFVVLNTFHSLRARYFTAAHELWHLSEGSLMQDENFDHERAADRFAAAIMLPKALIMELWNKFRKQGDEAAILQIADLADVPYMTVVRRLSELGENVLPVKKITEMEWITVRSELGFPISASDYSSKDTRFVAYEHAVKENVEKKGLDILIAANKLSKFAPKLAEQYQHAALSRGHVDEDES
ncbi:ImmA/IrrE family metallo-endopeptidase [Paenibacillus hexagrammi]|uniref:ImmA/IrrE family metallo-endopeptidase n=1 Tax=Paenibacillus hexagrammi TaxID=2908839 RepID=A0ABY3SLU8_9BACL|nr:ImmA/IrrE family metallo-endopeptidase [Paenibacillus sp. YPD9-1]UJF33927.1 ImmA/IrrE family metallo-endopeptidase [Paenibacillus sp. YPD9-1]